MAKNTRLESKNAREIRNRTVCASEMFAKHSSRSFSIADFASSKAKARGKLPRDGGKNRSFLRIFRSIERLKSYTRTRRMYYERTVRIVKECDIIFTRCIYIRIDLSVFLVNKRIDRQVRIFFSFSAELPCTLFLSILGICHVTPVACEEG